MSAFEITADGFVECEFDGRERRFRRELFQHTFTDDELSALIAGEYVEFDAVSKAGKPYKAVVRLGEYTYEQDGKERKGFGPRLDFDEMNKRRGIPATWCQHLFTAAEKKTLESGGKVHLEDCVSKKGKTFSCDVTFTEENPGEGKRIVPDFAK